MFIEQRREPRESLSLPLQLGDGNAAVTRDISPSGMYFEISGWHHMSGAVVFEMHLAESQLKFTAEGQVLRVEHALGTTGIAVRLLSRRLHSVR
jgi:hypothetical protein